jgi:hypothetical protein
MDPSIMIIKAPIVFRYVNVMDKQIAQLTPREWEKMFRQYGGWRAGALEELLFEELAKKLAKGESS